MADSYREHTGWQRYQPFFPPAMRCSDADAPAEERWSWRGHDVHLDRTHPAGAKLKVVVLHGAGAYGRVMAPAAVLAQRYGYATVAPDLPGYGLTRVRPADFTYDRWIDCVVDLVEAEAARDPIPIVLFGVSLGGLLAYQVAARSRRVVGLAATTLADTSEPEVRAALSRHRWLGTFGLWLLEKLAFVTDGLPLPMRWVSKMNRISNDPRLSAICSTDPLGGGSWVPARFLRTLMMTPPAVPPERFDTCPILLVHPGDDRMTDIAVSRRFFERLRGEKRMVVLEGASHMPTEHPGVDQLESEMRRFLDDLAKRHALPRIAA